MTVRPATPADAPDIARVYNQGIADRIATFETNPRSEDDIRAWFDGVHPIVVVQNSSGAVVAFAATSTYRPRQCYAGIAEISVYVARDARRQGAGKMRPCCLDQGSRTCRILEARLASIPGKHG